MSVTSSLKKVRASLFGSDPISTFHGFEYLRHNQRRLEHLASLGLPLAGRSVLEVGAGIGDHTSFFIDRGSKVFITEAREKSLAIAKKRFPEMAARTLDLDNPDQSFQDKFEIVYAYGLLYHLRNPAEAISYMAQRCTDILLLETCVSFGDELAINLVGEDAKSPSQAVSATGCRPTRRWVKSELEKHFSHVYCPKTQPCHHEFPIDWSGEQPPGLTRAIFVASRTALDLPTLSADIPIHQIRH